MLNKWTLTNYFYWYSLPIAESVVLSRRQCAGGDESSCNYFDITCQYVFFQPIKTWINRSDTHRDTESVNDATRKVAYNNKLQSTSKNRAMGDARINGNVK